MVNIISKLKKIIPLFIIIILVNVSAISAENNQNREYATQGIIEIIGGATFSYNKYTDNPYYTDSYYTGIACTVNYFFLQNIHAGIGPVFRYSRRKSDDNFYDSTFISAGSGVFLGYTIPLDKNLFFDVTAGYSSLFIYYDYSTGDALEQYDQTYSIEGTLKYVINNVIINTTLIYSYNDFKENESNFHSVDLGLGFSIFF